MGNHRHHFHLVLFLMLVCLGVLPAAGCGRIDRTLSGASGSAEDAGTKGSASGQEEQTAAFVFKDVFGQEYSMTVDSRVKLCPYDKSAFTGDGEKVSYEDETYTSRRGIDVSHHQGEIDWKKVAKQGISFAMIRIGYRGYGTEGKLCEDTRWRENYEQAKAAGLDVGVYFFAQAVNTKEAEEEAEYVLKLLDGRKTDLPIVYDPESILNEPARTDEVTGEQFTKNTRAFCERVRAAGYEPMVYCNMLWEAFSLDLEELSDIPVWYADYEDVPQTPYDFSIWQYSESGSVKGVNGSCDLNLQILPKE